MIIRRQRERIYSGICKSAVVSSSQDVWDSYVEPVARSWPAPSMAGWRLIWNRRGVGFLLIYQSQLIYRHKLPEPSLTAERETLFISLPLFLST